MWEFLRHLRASRELQRDLVKRNEIEEELRDNLSDLKRQVADLIADNASLKAEIADRQRAALVEQNRLHELLHEADRQKDQLLATLGHELRNPLSAIAGAIQVMSLSGSQDAEWTQMRQIIERQTSHMSRMINDLLELTRVSRGGLQIQSVRLDLVDVVRRTVENLRHSLSEENWSVILTLPETPVHISGDPNRLAQVLSSLLQNAATFTDAGGTVTVTVKSDHELRMALVTFQDLGRQMSSGTGSFESATFNEADNGFDGCRGGISLSRKLVKRLVELHGGQITTSNNGLRPGSEVTIHLPLAEAPSEIPQGERRVDGESQALRILIIDDQRDASYPLRKLLELDGHQVEVAADGPTGIQAASQIQPQVVLCDIGLPGGMNGFEVAQALRTDPRVAAALLVAVTGYGQDEDRRQSAAAGFDRHLTKPVGQSELRRLLSNVNFQRQS